MVQGDLKDFADLADLEDLEDFEDSGDSEDPSCKDFERHDPFPAENLKSF